MSKFTTLGQREVFDVARQTLVAAGFNPATAKLTSSVIRGEVAMSTSSTRFHLPVLVNDQQNGNAFNTEKRLQLQDVFVVSAVGLYCAAPASATATGFQLFTYGSPTVFSTANAAASIAGAYANGNISVAIDNDQTVPFHATAVHYKAPLTQAGTNVGYSASGNSQVDAIDGSDDGIFPLGAYWVLSGASQIDVNLNLPGAMAAIQSGARWVAVFYGVLAQNVSKIGA